MKAVVVHSGARDGYHVSRALAETGLLDTLVTDLYWPAERGWARRLESAMPVSLRRSLRQRWAGLDLSQRVTTCWVGGLLSLGLSKLARLPFSWSRWAMRWTDHRLGNQAARTAGSHAAALLSYSYYGHSAFTGYAGSGPRILFQLHPHPARVREILRRELEMHPECAESLTKEWELALPEEDFKRLVDEVQMADYWIAASSFTRQTLIESGVPEERIHVAPYGTDVECFRPDPRQKTGGRLKLLFVGRINQRKGIKYLLDAMDLLPAEDVELTVCGRVVDSLSLFDARRANVTVKPSVSAAELLREYQSADIFVFPSLAEGFGHVLLEAMACGLPVLSTTRTAATDLVREGREGFVVEPGRADLLAEKVAWFLANRQRLPAMGVASRRRAEEFTWPRFRESIADFAGEVLVEAPVAHV